MTPKNKVTPDPALRRVTRVTSECAREIIEELNNPPADTPARRSLFEMADRAAPLLDEVLRQAREREKS